MLNYWKIRAGEKGVFWDFWKAEGIVTIGWDIGRLEELNLSETKERIRRRYRQNDPDQVASMIRRFAGVAIGKPCLSKGDIVIVLGDAEVLDIATIKKEEYRYEAKGIPLQKSHTYWRDVEYKDYEHVKIRDLPSKFQQGGSATLHLPRTLMRYKYGEDNIHDLERNIIRSKEGIMPSKTHILQAVERLKEAGMVEIKKDELLDTLVSIVEVEQKGKLRANWQAETWKRIRELAEKNIGE